MRSASEALEGVAFSGVWVALAATGLCAAAARSMFITASPALLGMVFTGTFVVYNVDRLRDLPRDRRTTPRRSAFVARHEQRLLAACWLAALVAGLCALELGPRPVVTLLPVLGLGLLHRRVKHLAFAKAAYITAAWLLVVVVFPAVAAAQALHPGWAALVIGPGLYANAIASNVRDAEGGAHRLGARRSLLAARGVAALGLAAAAVAPGAIVALGWVPLAVLAALLRFRADERYGLVVVDGALLVGAVAAWWTAPRFA